jgi:hypothetical protein
MQEKARIENMVGKKSIGGSKNRILFNVDTSPQFTSEADEYKIESKRSDTKMLEIQPEEENIINSAQVKHVSTRHHSN